MKDLKIFQLSSLVLPLWSFLNLGYAYPCSTLFHIYSCKGFFSFFKFIPFHTEWGSEVTAEEMKPLLLIQLNLSFL